MIKTFYLSIAPVKTENDIETIMPTQKVTDDIMKSLNYILANKYKIKKIGYNSLKIEVRGE